MTRFVQGLMNGLGARRRGPAVPAARQVRPGVESLDDRLLLSAAHPPHHHGQVIHRHSRPALQSALIRLGPSADQGTILRELPPLPTPTGPIGTTVSGLSPAPSDQTLAVTDDQGHTAVFELRHPYHTDGSDYGVLSEDWVDQTQQLVPLNSGVVGPGPSPVDVTHNVVEQTSVTKISAGIDANVRPMVIALFADGTAWEYQDADARGNLLPQGQGVWTWLQPATPDDGSAFIGIGSGTGAVSGPPGPPSASVRVVDVAAGVAGEAALVDADGNLHFLIGLDTGQALDHIIAPPAREATGHLITQVSVGWDTVDVLFGDQHAWEWSPEAATNGDPTGGWAHLGSGVQAVAAGGWGVSDVLYTDGSLVQYFDHRFGWSRNFLPLATHVQAMTLSPDAQLPGRFRTDMVIGGEAFEEQGGLDPLTGAIPDIPPFIDLGGVLRPGPDGAVQGVFVGSGGSSILVYSDGVVKLHNPALFADDVSVLP